MFTKRVRPSALSFVLSTCWTLTYVNSCKLQSMIGLHSWRALLSLNKILMNYGSLTPNLLSSSTSTNSKTRKPKRVNQLYPLNTAPSSVSALTSWLMLCFKWSSLPMPLKLSKTIWWLSLNLIKSLVSIWMKNSLGLLMLSEKSSPWLRKTLSNPSASCNNIRNSTSFWTLTQRNWKKTSLTIKNALQRWKMKKKRKCLLLTLGTRLKSLIKLLTTLWSFQTMKLTFKCLE